MHRLVVAGLVGAVVVAIAAPASALADEVVEAQIVWRFDATSYTVDQGEPLLFRNRDAASPGPHNVTAVDAAADGQPLFASATIRNGQEAVVEGSRALTTGVYPFICTVHPFMRATLNVTGAGTPYPPPPALDTRGPGLRVSLRRASVRSKRFRAAVVSDEPAGLSARLTARVRGRTVRVGRASARAIRAGDPVTLAIRASRRARRAMRKADRATLVLAVEARDAAGNVGRATARRKIVR